MTRRIEITMAGTGGQGVILAGIILADAAGLRSGMHVAQTQSYGPEARGGASKAEVVISDAEIDYPKVILPDVLLAMSQMACDRYGTKVGPEGWLIIEADQVRRAPPHPNTVRVSMTRIAEDEIGLNITANMVGLGVIVGLTGIVQRQAICQAIEKRTPAGTRELNVKAFEAGLTLGMEFRVSSP